jgi:hypothetical protein
MSMPNPHPKTDLPPQQPIKARTELKVVQHSMLFYWWPVWAVGFLLALVTWADGGRMAVLPGNTTIERTSKDAYELKVNGTPPARSGGTELGVGEHMALNEAKNPFGLHIAREPFLGVIFMITLMLVIVITNVPLRGLWSVVTIVLIVLGCAIISLIPGAWEAIARTFWLLNIHINAMGYLFISAVLFVIWVITVFWFDQQVYILFTPGLMKVRETIGSGETAYDTSSMTIEHLRDDIFRHWILGLGSGDLVVHPAGPQSREIRLNNVLFVSSRLQLIEQFKRTGVVTSAG